MWEKRYEPKSGTAHVGECSPGSAQLGKFQLELITSKQPNQENKVSLIFSSAASVCFGKCRKKLGKNKEIVRNGNVTFAV